ncbi:amidohydrolase 2 [Trematosphaeria pertusa]|uniref:Amidohydrolase 2 n=1 Tax=Trematosphaeria pertusa TaxID=390896 RepID=A0A6A6J4W8_9PLEO|nr:amidohydrolase 2 [Trematosphaeria pertusa]KAF2256533.1 amidohydrolase 2 [Trematosphaeria pertusa]
MLNKIALEEAWNIPDAGSLGGFQPGSLAPKGVIGGDLGANLLDVHGTRLQQMDENGVEFMVLSLVSAGPQGIADREAAEKLARVGNDALSKEVMKNPKRFAGLVSLSMHDPSQASQELRRCWTELQGFVGVILNDFQSAGSDGNTMLYYDDPAYDTFWKTAEELNAPVYIHPRSATPEITEKMWKGREHLAFSALGYANRVNMHLLGIITAGVLDRFPRLKLVVGHMGEHIPYDLYRIDHKLNRARFPNMRMRKDRLVRDYFGTQVFITTSGHFSTPALLCAIAEIGVEACMFSIDYPFESIPNGCVWFDEHAGRSFGLSSYSSVFSALARYARA